MRFIKNNAIQQTPLETTPTLLRPKGLWGGLFLAGQEGYFVSVIAIFILIIMSSIALSMSSLIFYRQKISTNSIRATQSYYTAEAGIEDALMRLKNDPQMSPISYSFPVNDTTAAVNIPAIIGTSRVVTSQGDATSRIRNIQVVYTIDSDGVSFHYGAQVGDGGLQMSNSSRVIGNVFSNGNITGSGSATIDNNVVVAGVGNSISGMDVGGNVLTYSCSNSSITGTLTYVSPGGTNNCTATGGIFTQSSQISSQPMPISDQQITDWKNAALAGGTTGSVTLSGTETMSLGPKKIIGDLSLSNSSVLTLTGTVYVTGNITINNSSTIKLDSSFGSLGGIIIADGIISPSNSSTLQGSGQSGSYLLVLSNNVSDSAITVSNSASGAIFYTSAGGITVSNSFSAREVTGYKLTMSNSATITYESGLANALFTSGPTAGWKVIDWKEQ